MGEEFVESFLDVKTSSATEPIAVDPGEYEIRLTGGVIDTDKNQHPYFMPYYEIPSEPHAKDFSDFFGLPYDGKPEKDLNNDNWKLECFKKCFGLEKGKFSLKNDLPGLTGWALLGKRETPDYGEQNTVKKYVLPK